MTQNKIVETIVRFTVDENAARQASRAAENVHSALTAGARATTSVEQAARGLNAQFSIMARQKALDTITARAIEAGKKTKDWAAALREVSTELANIGATDNEISGVGQAIGLAEGGGRGRRVGSVGSLGREIRALPAVNISGSLSTDAIGKILYTVDSALTKMGASAAQVGKASLIAAPALVLLAVGMGNYNLQMTRQKAALDGALAAQDRYFQALSSFSTAQAAQALQTESARLDSLRRQRAEVQTALDSAFAQAQRAFTDPLARALDAVGQLPTAQLRDQLKQLDAQIASTEGYTVRLSDGIRNLEFASRDALSDVEAAIAQREKFQQIQTRVQLNEIQLQVRANQMTSDAREKRRAEIDAEISILEQAASSTTLTWQAQSDLNAQITALRTESEILSRTFSSAADAAAELAERTAAATAAVKLQTSNYFDAVTKTTEAQEAVFKTAQDAQEAYTEYIADSLAISTEAEAKRNEILAESADTRAEIVRKTEDEIAKIQRDAGRSQFRAVAEREALASYQAALAAKDKLDDAKKDQTTELSEKDRAQEKALNSLRSNIQREAAARDGAYRTQQQQLAQAALRAQIDLSNAKNAEAQIAQFGAGTQRAIMSNMWGELQTVTINGVTAILTAARQLVGGLGGTQMYVNGVNQNSPAAYDVFNVRSEPAQFNRLWDQRFNDYARVTQIGRD